MKLTTGLGASLGVLLAVFFTWGVATDPDGFAGLIRKGERPEVGAVLLSDHQDETAPQAEAGEEAGSGDEEAWPEEDLDEGAELGPLSAPVIVPFPPPDQALLEDDFALFLKNLKAAAKAGDLEAILAASHDEISFSFGADPGREGFRGDLTHPDYGQEVWAALVETLALPAAKAEGYDFDAYCVPYFWCMELPEEASAIDVYEMDFILGEDIPVLSAPDAAADEIMRLSYAAVWAQDRFEFPGWVKIGLSEDLSGFVAAEHIRPLIDYRAVFEKTDGKWTMIVFIAGD